MALLSKSNSNMTNVIAKLDGSVCILFYLVGLVWFLALAHHQLSSPTYFSENALLPGLVDSEFFHDYGAVEYHKELTQLLNDQQSTDDIYQIPSAWLTDKFRRLGLDTYVQNYTFRYPFGVYDDRNLSGQNVYGILRAPRTAGTEAIVLSIPFRPELSGHEATYPGIALVLGLAKAFRRHSYWAKDIIVLVTDNQEVGIEAWLSSYHHTPNKYIEAGVLPSRSGSIQAAINLELSSRVINKVNIKFEGVNGKLPNLDLINTVERLFYREGLKINIQKMNRDFSINEWSRYVHSLKTMLSMVWNQAPGTPTGNHGFFHKYNIEAITIHGVKSKSKKNFDFTDTGRVIEGIFRSLNNLLERFHQSFFFYLLPSPNRYISIGVYMPPLGIMILPVLIRALSLWLRMSVDCKSDGSGIKAERGDNKEEAEQEKDAKSVSEDDNDVQKSSLNGNKDEKVDRDEVQQEPIDKLSHGAVFTMAALIGICSFYSTDYFVRSADSFGINQEEGLALGFLIIHLLIIVHPYILKWRMAKKTDSFKLNRNVLTCFNLLFFGIVIGTISVMNVSMAFLIATAWVPIILINKPTRSRLLTLLKYILIILASPLSLLFIGGIIGQTVINQNTKGDLLVIANKAWIDVQDGLMLSAFQFYLFDNWTFPLLNFLFIPIWSLFWLIATVND